MTPDLDRLVESLRDLPLYATAFVGIGLVLRLRRTHPRAPVWAEAHGRSVYAPCVTFNPVPSALQTAAAALRIAAAVTGRRGAP